MVRDNRIKEVRFSETISAADTVTTYWSEYPLNGEILEVDVDFNRAGSVYLGISGTNEEFFRRNAASGAATIVGRPRVFSESTTGSIANADHVPFVVNDKIFLATGSTASGTQTLNVNVRYR